MRSFIEYVGILIPAGMALLLFSAFQSTIQMDHLGRALPCFGLCSGWAWPAFSGLGR